MKSLIKEFREFINRGNVVDLAVAVVIGAAFTAIVNSVVNDLIMPLISLFTGGIDFSQMKISIGTGEHAAAFTYGNFIDAVINFLIVAVVVFLIVRAINDMKKQADRAARHSKVLKKIRGANGEEEVVEVPAEPVMVECPYCFEQVREGATRCPHCAGAYDAPLKKAE